MPRSRRSLEELTNVEDRLPLYKRASWVYAVILGGVGVAIIAAEEEWTTIGWLQRNGPNFGADLIGLAITLLLVDRIVAWRRDAELHPRRQSIIRRLGEGVRDLEIQMAWVYKAGSRPTSEPPTVYELIDGFVDVLPRLDFRAPASTTPAPLWLTFLPGHLERIIANLDRTVTRHEELMPAGLAAAVDAVVDDPSMRLLRNESALVQALATVEQDDLLPLRGDLAENLKRLYREYAAFRGRPYALMAWEIPRPWGNAIRQTATHDHASASGSSRQHSPST